ncbi:threonine/serine dehydratase [Metabacillus litoralis]|uniref:threonine ammonia-lyase n=1 Tax=Metabacillus litoralis TaxID=152268 RepID=UPI00203DD843|nr:threonine/serine dehydratase [Metabacillus litoralis]MCM3163702.1 threonine/serine dehydratase [Metabacillus litoralis]
MEVKQIKLDDIIAAHHRIKSYIRHTTLEHNPKLSYLYDSKIFLKLENHQVTGSFKARGSFNKLLTLDQSDQKRGVIAPSAGNHGIGLAYAAGKLSIPAYVYLPKDADESKVKTLKMYGASISFFDSIENARLTALRDAKENGYTFLSAYNNPAMVTAGGTIGLEILEDLSDVDVVISCLGGGGLTAGICIALKTLKPNIQIWGVQTEKSPTFAVWHKTGKPVPVNLEPSIAEGLSGPIEPETITFPIIHKYLDKVITVSEEEIIHAMREMLDDQYIIEPSGAAGIASLNKVSHDIKGLKTAILVTGRNVSWSRFSSLISS